MERVCTAVEAAHLLADLRELYRGLPGRHKDGVRGVLVDAAAPVQPRLPYPLQASFAVEIYDHNGWRDIGLRFQTRQHAERYRAGALDMRVSLAEGDVLVAP